MGMVMRTSIATRAKTLREHRHVPRAATPKHQHRTASGIPSKPDTEATAWQALASAAQSAALALAAAGVITTATFPALALETPSITGLSYEDELQRVNHGTGSESSATAEQDDPVAADLFTDDALKGMVKLRRYNRYVQNLERVVEAQPGCEGCRANRKLLENVWQVVANEFYDPNDRFTQSDWGGRLQEVLARSGGALHTQQETYTAAQQLVDYLGDKYSAFLQPTQFRAAIRQPLPAERSYLEAQYVGVGLQLGGTSPLGGREVVAPLAESPAEAAGIEAGNRLLRIDGVRTSDLTMDEVTTLLRGPAGSSVELEVAGAQEGERPRELLLERQALPQPAVKVAQLSTPGGGLVTYVRMHYFASETTRALARALRQGEIDGVDGYVLDLRNNPGGVFEEAIACAQLLLDCHCNITETVRSGSVLDTVFTAGDLPPEIFSVRGAQTSAPVVVLVNRASASASEVLSGALRDNHRATLIGQRTFGKGVVQYYFPMADGSGLKLTIAKYLTPDGYDITKQGGMAPDLLCDDYPHGIFNGSGLRPGGKPDACVLQALDAIMADKGQLQQKKLQIDPEKLKVLYAGRL